MSTSHLVSYITRTDVDVVLARIPEPHRLRVRDIHLWGDSRAVRTLGWVTTRGRRDINLCVALPPRVSLRRFMFAGRIASDFGGPARGQWPPWAVRRYLLYNTLLHELGHLQVAGAPPGTWDGDFASDGLAQAFANEWRGRLYSEPFDHPDPVHHAPTDDERAALPFWESLDKPARMQLTQSVVGRRLIELVAPAPADSFLRRLGSTFEA